MNVSNLRVNVNIALAIYVIKQLKCRGGPLSDPLELDHKLQSITKYYFSWLKSVSGNYLLKENVIITFRSYVRIVLESYIRLMLGNYVKTSCKWDQEIT